jgi:hypothetical protein
VHKCAYQYFVSCAMAQAVSRRPLTPEVRVHTRDSPCVIFWCTKWHWDGVHSELFGFPCQYHSTVAVSTRISSGMNSRPVCGCSSETQSHPIGMNMNMNTPYVYADSEALSRRYSQRERFWTLKCLNWNLGASHLPEVC